MNPAPVLKLYFQRLNPREYRLKDTFKKAKGLGATLESPYEPIRVWSLWPEARPASGLDLLPNWNQSAAGAWKNHNAISKWLHCAGFKEARVSFFYVLLTFEALDPILRPTVKPVAGWSSLVARRAHNPKVVGSNPAPATNNPFQMFALAEHVKRVFAFQG
jgi:hypothetical protein